jgi:vacuolar-type H+-ATPase subunit D/Vma8
MKKMIIGLALLLSVSLYAQSTDTYVELLRSNLQMEKKTIIAEAMELNAEQSEKFWPIYNEFQLESSKLGDKKLAIIKKYAENYENLTNDIADDLIESSFDLDEDRTDLNKEYYKKIKKALNAKHAGKFIQLISRINTLIDIQLSAEIPLLPIHDVEGDKE